MASNELNPLYRTLVGFDRIASLMDTAARLDAAPGYPPFNVEQIGEDEAGSDVYEDESGRTIPYGGGMNTPR